MNRLRVGGRMVLNAASTLVSALLTPVLGILLVYNLWNARKPIPVTVHIADPMATCVEAGLKLYAKHAKEVEPDDYAEMVSTLCNLREQSGSSDITHDLHNGWHI